MRISAKTRFRAAAHAAAVSLALSSGACATVYGPSLRAERASLVGVGTEGVRVTVRISAYNHNDFDLAIDKMTARVVLSGTDLGTTTLEETWTLAARTATPIEAEFVVPYRALPTLVLGTLLEGRVPYRVTGHASLENAPITVEYVYEGYVDRAMLLGAALSGGAPSSGAPPGESGPGATPPDP